MLWKVMLTDVATQKCGSTFSFHRTNSRASWTQMRIEGCGGAGWTSTGSWETFLRSPSPSSQADSWACTILISEMDFTPRHNKVVFVTRKEGATVARTFWVLFIQISMCREQEGRGGNRMLPTLGLTAGVDALGRAGAAPDSLSFTHWFIPQIFAEHLQCTRHSRKHVTFITSCNSFPQPHKRGK